jgi:hypothetical protein
VRGRSVRPRADLALLAQIFPTGVCDYTKPAKSRVNSVQWLTYENGPGGQPLGAVPVSTAVLAPLRSMNRGAPRRCAACPSRAVEVVMRSAFSILVLLLVPSVFASAATIVAPNGYAAVEGNEAGSFPFTNFTGRYQQAYAANEFGSGPISISEIAFRTDASAATQSWLNQLAFSLRLSTSVNPVGSLSTTFANNIGADDTLVYTAPALAGVRR